MKPEELEIQICPAPVLWEKGKTILKFDEEFRACVMRMYSIVIQKRAEGMAASQVGWPVRVFVVRTVALNGTATTEAYVNPTLTPVTKKKRASLEGCLSFPGMDKTIQRYTEVRIKYVNLYGHKKVKVVKDWLEARCMQHEYDHIRGKTCISKEEYATYLKENEGKIGTLDPA